MSDLIGLGAQDTATPEQRQIRRLKHEVEMLTNAGVIECMVRNKAVAEYIGNLEAERDALKVDAAKQFQAGHAAGLEDAAVCAWSWLMDNARKGGVTPAVDARFGVCDAIRAMKEQA